MSSEADVCNTALSIIGSRAVIAALDPPDGTMESRLCRIFYAPARRAALALGSWSFARKRVALAAVAAVGESWAYAYTKPSDCLKPLFIPTVGPYHNVFHEAWVRDHQGTYSPSREATADYIVEGQTILTNEPEAVLVYMVDVPEVPRWSPPFFDVVALMLAARLAGPIIKGAAGGQVAESLSKQAAQRAAEAEASDANASQEPSWNFIPSSVQARA